jgi:putative membrane protein
LGIFAAIFTLAEGLSWALENYPTLVWGFFFGLVVASIITVRKRIKKWTPTAIFAMVAAAVALYVIIGLVPAETPEAGWFLFLTGAVVICGMILPGISGAFLMVLLGKYEYILNAVVERDFVPLILVALGAGIGLLSIARFLKWLFANYHDVTVAALIGLMIGSLRKIWPWKETLTTTIDRHGAVVPLTEANILPSSMGEFMIVLGLMLLGVALVLVLDRFSPDEQLHA